MTIAEAKRHLRTWMIRNRQAIPVAARIRKSRAITRHVVKNAIFKRSKIVAVFLGFASEVQTEGIVKAAWRKGKTVVVPMTDNGFNKSYFAVFKKGARTAASSRGPLELLGKVKPSSFRKIDLVLVPGLAFDRHGTRLGYGGGVYDVLLKKASRAASIGLYFSEQEMAHLPKEKHDYKLDGVITETGLQRFA